eukprot:TRINITY_DN16641_c0_g1_i1.p1 TRINITY_DN16641_c0_g1~~TRINITY_DN16641_c0_g1_i1.p1  ORF type:complete len:398 (+),score=90.10 TRINITY_DN16641_c0_g1_i1:2-1195(+)
MKRGGYYSAHTLGAAKVIENAWTIGTRALNDHFLTLPADRKPFVIADYGAADGGTSRMFMRNAIETIRARISDSRYPISIFYEDVPNNDFSALFGLMHSQEEPHRSLSPYHLNENVFIFGAGTTFYQQVLPDETVHFGFSATAMHWLSRLPTTLTDEIHSVALSNNSTNSDANSKQRELFAAQAKKDWETILLHRARELVDGGKLLIVMFSIDAQGRYLGHNPEVCRADMFSTLNNIWRQLRDENVISKEEYEKITFPQYYRTRAELLEPFQDPNSPVSKEGLVVECVESHLIRCPYHERYLASLANKEQHPKDLKGDQQGEGLTPEEYADVYVPTVRSWSEGLFLSGLSSSRSLEEKHRIGDEFFKRYARVVASDPTAHGMDYVHEYLLISKQKKK